MPSKLLRLILYIRVSTAREDMISPELQEHTGRKYAADIGAAIIDVIYDLDLDGHDFAKRKIGAIIARVASDEADGVLVYRYDRFGRNTELSLTNIRMLEGIGGVAKSATEHFDTKTAAGRLARTNMLGIAEFQRDIIGENWMSTHANRLRNGLPHHGAPRFGYWYCDTCPMPKPRSPRGVRREHKKRETCEKCKSGIQIPRPRYGPALAYAYSEFSDGKPLTRVAHELTLDGLRTYGGHIITDKSLLAAMDTGFGAGYLRVTPGAQSWADELPESAVDGIGIAKIDRFVWIPGAHRQVIESEDVWEGYLERRRAGTRIASHKTRAKYPASGLVFCIDCGDKQGKAMRAGSSRGARGSKYLTWRCGNIDTGQCNHSNASREAVDSVILKWLLEWAKDDGTARAVAEAAVSAEKQQPDDSAHWSAEITRLKTLKKNLVRMRAAEEIDQQEFIEQRDEYAAEIAAAEAKLKRSKSYRVPTIPKREIFQGLMTEWPHLDDDTKRAALRKVIWRITASRGEFHDEGRYKIIPMWERPILEVEAS
ncbi:recombinase family protein [Streptomyces yunnanensis]|uniref:Recombinase family protein n=1 Tax=Streptomyces yunnanensis TaxID=156453 RepID=A0ABY8A8F9_9ACTN|nr:recombinase family protein [Streptomyces yunnanensis]WEB41259.1 recombinase family protein [Streptomyces yunnanensis]